MAPFSSFCTDFYVNQKIALKLDLPTGRETVLHMFDRVRREFPRMERFRRYEGELALESPDTERTYSWVALRQTSVRSGWVNPETCEQAYRLHRLLLETAPYFLSISAIDIDHLDLVFGFDLEAEHNRDQVVFDALFGDSPLAGLLERNDESIVDAQPFIGINLGGDGLTHAFVEVKTRPKPDETHGADGRIDPISVYLTVRRIGGIRVLDEGLSIFASLAEHAEQLAEQRVVPHVLAPIHAALFGNH